MATPIDDVANMKAGVALSNSIHAAVLRNLGQNAIACENCVPEVAPTLHWFNFEASDPGNTIESAARLITVGVREVLAARRAPVMLRLSVVAWRECETHMRIYARFAISTHL